MAAFRKNAKKSTFEIETFTKPRNFEIEIFNEQIQLLSGEYAKSNQIFCLWKFFIFSINNQLIFL